jgi:hypothetical protein
MVRVSLGLCVLGLLLVAGYGVCQQFRREWLRKRFGKPATPPTVTAIAPSSAIAGIQQRSLLFMDGSAFQNGAVVNSNNSVLTTTYVSSSRLTATIPASDLTAVSTAKITVTNPIPTGITVASNAESFTIAAAPASTTWVRYIGIVPKSIAWDPVHALICASIPSTDPASPNTIVAVNPVTGESKHASSRRE